MDCGSFFNNLFILGAFFTGFKKGHFHCCCFQDKKLKEYFLHFENK